MIDDAAIQAQLQTPEMLAHIRRLYQDQVLWPKSPKSAFAMMHTIPPNMKSLRSSKVKRPAGLSGRQWKRVRKSLRKIAESGCQ